MSIMKLQSIRLNAFITDQVRSTMEGNVFTGAYHSVQSLLGG